jgi:hypothetical protein
MSFIQNLQNKTQGEKIRIIWITVIVVALALGVVWVFTSRIGQSIPKDTTLFKTFGAGLKDIRAQYNK